MEDEKRMKAIELPVIIPSDAPRIYATGSFGGYSSHDFRLLIYSEEPLQKDEYIVGNFDIIREIQAEIIMPPLAAKQTAKWLMDHVEAFEKEFGPIPEPKIENMDEE